MILRQSSDKRQKEAPRSFPAAVALLALCARCLILSQNFRATEAITLAESVNEIKSIIEESTSARPTNLTISGGHLASGAPGWAALDGSATSEISPSYNDRTDLAQAEVEKRALVRELFKLLHEQYGTTQQGAAGGHSLDQMQSRQGQLGFGPDMMHSLLNAIGADGDMRRLTEWIRNTFNVASIPDLTTQFVVSKLGSVNCAALLKPDREEKLVPRFLLFNEHYTDVPFELSISPNADECIAQGKFDPRRKTIILVHGYLTGYTLVDGMTNIKNLLLDLNRLTKAKATETFVRAAEQHAHTNSSYVYTDDLNFKIRSQLYNVILVDWFNGANPTPRSNYIKAAVNAQVVGKLIARFLSALVVQCGTPAANLQIIAHSLGCHVSGFTGKAMNAAGHRLGRITHLDPVGLCFGRLFSQPRFRLSPNDALETQAVHVSLNIFDNPLDGAHSNFLVNGGRDQVGCGGQSEVKNSTTSSVSLLFDPATRFAPCSHLRALALFEDDHSSEPGQCQLVGYRCQSYDKFLAGRCGFCDATNSQCRLMSLPPVSLQFRKLTLGSKLQDSDPKQHLANFYNADLGYDLHASASFETNSTAPAGRRGADSTTTTTTATTATTTMMTTTTTAAATARANGARRSSSRAPTPTSSTLMFGAPSYLIQGRSDEMPAPPRSNRGILLSEKRERLAQAVEKLRTETRTALTSGWTNLRLGNPAHSTQVAADDQSGEESNAEEFSFASATSASPTSAGTTSTVQEATTTTEAAAAAAGGVQNFSETPNELPNDGNADPAHDTDSSSRLQDGSHDDQVPLGSQKPPSGSLNMPQYFLGTGAISPYCVNYYQFRVLISDSRLQRVLKSNGLGSNKLMPQLSQHRGGVISAASAMQNRVVKADGRDMLHLTVKLTDTRGRFFKGFSMLENAREITRVPADSAGLASGGGGGGGLNGPMVELTMLLNSTRPEPQKIGETIISYYFHQVVLADRVEINYMSNIAPEIRAKYSSVLCPVAINDRHQLVRYIECQRVGPSRR